MTEGAGAMAMDVLGPVANTAAAGSAPGVQLPAAPLAPASAAGIGYSLFPSLSDLIAQPPAGTLSGLGGIAPGTQLASAAEPLSYPLIGSAAGPTAQAPATLAPLIAQVAQAHGLPASLLTALVRQESGFNPGARSPVGAMGLTQLMPGTAAALGVTDPWDPVENLNGGATYLAGLLQAYGGNVALALAAYNAGPGAVSQWGGIPPYPETQAYVRNVMAMAGLSPPPGPSPPSGAGPGR